MQNLKDNYYILIIIAMTGASLLVVLFISLQIRNQNKLLRQQKKIQEIALQHQKDLLHAVILSQEEERNRIGMDLHDEVGTVLSSLRMTIETFAGEAPPIPAFNDFNGHCKQIIDAVIKNVRSISHNLSPFTGDMYGFIDAVEDLCQQVNQSQKINIGLQWPPDEALPPLPGPSALALYRVIAELINNTIRHAHAAGILLSFETAGQCLLVDYKDDGRGLPAVSDKKGMGMRNMESRLGLIGATYILAAPGGQGFAVQIKIPAGANA